jgi:hypothetical protein
VTEIKFSQPFWCLEFLSDDKIIVGTRNQQQSYLLIYEIKFDQLHLIEKIAFEGNFKRIKRIDESNVLINGNGKIHTQIYNLKNRETLKLWEKWQLNTCEDAIQIENYIYTITYGYQLNTYDFASYQILSSQLPFVNYPKKILHLHDQYGHWTLVVGRTNFVSIFNINNDNQTDRKLMRQYFL